MCFIQVGWRSDCPLCLKPEFQIEMTIEPPYDDVPEGLWAPDCDCFDKNYRWDFYNINPLEFVEVGNWPAERECFQNLCDECRGAGPISDESDDDFAEMESMDEKPMRLGRYGPGFNIDSPSAIPPPYPRHGEATPDFDPTPSTSVASTPRQDDYIHDEDHDVSTWYADSEPQHHMSHGGFFTDGGNNMQWGYPHEMTQGEQLDAEYRELYGNVSRGSVNRKDADLGLAS